MQVLNILLIPILLTIFLIFSLVSDITGNIQFQKQNISVPMEELEGLPIQNVRIKDTVFVMGNSYIEISLQEQLCRLYIIDDNGKEKCNEYKVSSGNPNIPEGLETTTGLFSVQTKNPLGKSKQFNDAELHNWVGFNVNYGIHGLAGNGYYRYLGVRASSHGCVRISREDGKKVYDKVKFGTPVLVYDNEPAIILKFADTIGSLSKYYILPSDARSFNNTMRQRQQNIYDGVVYLNSEKKLLLDGETIIRWGGYRIGKANNIPYKQKIRNPQIHTVLLKDRVGLRNIENIIEVVLEENDIEESNH